MRPPMLSISGVTNTTLVKGSKRDSSACAMSLSRDAKSPV